MRASPIDRASKYVSVMPPAISGSRGHRALFDVAVALRYGFDLSEDEAWPILLAYNERCDPPWSERELRHKLDSAGKMTRHEKPRGWLLGETGRLAVPAVLPTHRAEPLMIRRERWQDTLAKLAASKSTLLAPDAETLPAAALLAGFTALKLSSPSLEKVHAPTFGDETAEAIRRTEAILNLRGASGRPGYTASQIEACRIALQHDAKVPEVSAMLARLEQAKGAALTAAKIAGHATGNFISQPVPGAHGKASGPVRHYTMKGNRRFVK